MLELFRQLSLLDFQALYLSPQWRTYLALHATFMSLADGDLRDEVRRSWPGPNGSGWPASRRPGRG